MPPEGQLTEDQAAVYDRQLRVWGHAVQQRLNSARILILGGDCLAAEIAKNLVLAGVGNVAVADDTPVSKVHPGNFLVPADVQDPMTVGQAAARTLSAMNPLITVTSASLGVFTPGQPVSLQASSLADHDLIVSCCGLSKSSADSLEAVCAEAGKQLYIAEVFGYSGYAFVNLGPAHTYTEQKQGQPQQQPSSEDGVAAAAAAPPDIKTAAYPRLSHALSRPVSKCLGKRPLHALYQVLRVVRDFESQHGKAACQDCDITAVKAVARQIEQAEGAPAGSISDELLEAWVAEHCSGSFALPSLGTSPAAAVTGGVLANTIIRAISRVGAPLKNFFLFSLTDGAGVIEDLP